MTSATMLKCKLQGIREYQSDTFDDWRDLLEEQERRTRDELDASKVHYKASDPMQLYCWSRKWSHHSIDDTIIDSPAVLLLWTKQADSVKLESNSSLCPLSSICKSAVMFHRVCALCRLLWRVLRSQTLSCQHLSLMSKPAKYSTPLSQR